MIDWGLVARHAIWISGAAIVVATWSFRRSFRFSRGTLIGATLFCAGMAAVSFWAIALLWLAIPFTLPWHRS